MRCLGGGGSGAVPGHAGEQEGEAAGAAEAGDEEAAAGEGGDDEPEGGDEVAEGDGDEVDESDDDLDLSDEGEGGAFFADDGEAGFLPGVHALFEDAGADAAVVFEVLAGAFGAFAALADEAEGTSFGGGADVAHGFEGVDGDVPGAADVAASVFHVGAHVEEVDFAVSDELLKVFCVYVVHMRILRYAHLILD